MDKFIKIPQISGKISTKSADTCSELAGNRDWRVRAALIIFAALCFYGGPVCYPIALFSLYVAFEEFNPYSTIGKRRMIEKRKHNKVNYYVNNTTSQKK